MSRILGGMVAGALVLAGGGTIGEARADGPKVHGATIGDWGQAWWQWAVRFPMEGNPIVEDGAVDCSRGQAGRVWFLA